MTISNSKIRSGRLRRSRRSSGFTLIELIIGLAVSTIILIALYQVFETNSSLARSQTDVADMQQSLRVAQTEMARLVRMAGRGGLADIIVRGPNRFTPAVQVRDNAATGGDPQPAEIAPGFANSPTLVPGTDVLMVRGVFTSPIYQVNNANPASFTLFDAGGAPTTDPAQAATGQVVVTDPSPSGIPQDLMALSDAINDNTAEGLVIVSPVDDSIYAVVELTGGNAGPGQVTLQFDVNSSNHPEYRNLWASGTGGNPVLPTALSATAQVGIVEEYRFYIREGLPNPTLSMARMFPGTDTPYKGLLNESRLDISDNVIDLQVALGFDSSLGAVLVDRNGDGNTDEDDILITETTDGQNDDWLFNSDADDPAVAPWIPPWSDDPLSGLPPQPELYYVRVNTFARVQAPDRNYLAPTVAGIENNTPTRFNNRDEQIYRRQLLQTVIDLRNI